jgi:hypothetical protein
MSLTESMLETEKASEALVNSLKASQRVADKRDPFVELVLQDIRVEATRLNNRIVWAAGAARRAKL